MKANRSGLMEKDRRGAKQARCCPASGGSGTKGFVLPDGAGKRRRRGLPPLVHAERRALRKMGLRGSFLCPLEAGVFGERSSEWLLV